MLNSKVLVLGFYNSKNIGDELFKEAFKHLFNFTFKFVKNIYLDDLRENDIVFIGGGSLLDTFNISKECFEILKTKKVFYIGVGVESYIDPKHLELMKLAKLIAIRSEDQLSKIKSINTNTILIPDLVFALQDKLYIKNKIKKKILVMPNILVVPNNKDPNWMHASYNYFKSEFSQFLDCLAIENYQIDFFAMSSSKIHNDEFAAIEIINSMSNKDVNILKNNYTNINDLNFSEYEVIITQRFHGMVLSEMNHVPFLCIHHHNKLKNTSLKNGVFSSYYGLNKNDLLEKFNLLKTFNFIPIKTNIFTDLKDKINNIFEGI